MFKRIKFEYGITSLYLFLGGLWILFSDKLLSSIIYKPDLLTTFQTYKGWLFVIVTAILFYSILKKHLIKLRNAELKARQSDSLKTAFLHNISHEIRTPMNSIIGFSGLLEDTRLPVEKRTEYLKIISNASNQLLRIVEGLVDISIIETGNNRIIESKVNLNDLLDEITSSFVRDLKSEISFSSDKGLNDESSVIITDEMKVRKALSNLLNNAFKFTERGSVSFGYTRKMGELEFFVSDTGQGISRDLQNRIFKCFQKGEEYALKFHEGMGVGLAVCKAYIEILDGRIWLKSEPGQGSTFYFTIPYKPINRN